MLRLPLVLVSALTILGPPAPAAAQYLAETREIVWSDPDEPALLAKATELGSAVAMYEFVRNEFVFRSYDGARSNSTNTFLNRRGNDVDLASVLISMLRSQNIPARYVEGQAYFTEGAVTSWLEIPNATRATFHLQDTGYPGVAVGGGRIAFRHAWVQALVPLESYRGAGDAAQVDCTAEPARCTWVDLDPSFKRHHFRDPEELVDISNAVFFDYDAFYHADDPGFPSPDGLDRASKNPLEIYEEQTLQHLHTVPGLEGKTLEDVVYEGEIIPEVHGILPTSLPFRIDPSEVQTYASVDEHDAAPGAIPWTKTVSFAVTFPDYAPFASLTLSGGAPVPLADLSTQDLTFAYESTDFDAPSVPKQLVVRLGGQVHEVMLTLTGNSFTSNGGNGTITGDPPDVGTRMDVYLTMDTAATTALSTTLSDLAMGGVFLVGTGGPHSGWSQVHRSARRLLVAVEENPVLPNESEGGLLYVDANQNGSIDAGEIPLLEDAATQNLLTGGVLAIAKDLYCAQVWDAFGRVAKLHRSSMPLTGLLGVVRTVHDVRSLDGTAFQIVPTGLYVDLKGAVVPPFKIDADLPNDRTFRLGGHVASAFEHQIWEELTGFEAISTMKGIQRTIADGGMLMLLDEAQSQVPLATALANWGLQSPLPAGFSSEDLDLFGHRIWLPRTTAGTKTLNVLRGVVDATTPEPRRRAWELELHTAGSDFELLFRFFEGILAQIDGAPGSQGIDPPFNASVALGLPDPGCVTATTVGQLASNLPSCFASLMSRPELAPWAEYLAFFDKNAGFSVGAHLYRDFDVALHIRATSLAGIRDELVLGADENGDGTPAPDTTVEVVAPSIVADGELLDLAVWIRRYFDANGVETSSNYIIRDTALPD